jgi:hypothetical protein
MHLIRDKIKMRIFHTRDKKLRSSTKVKKTKIHYVDGFLNSAHLIFGETILKVILL